MLSGTDPPASAKGVHDTAVGLIIIGTGMFLVVRAKFRAELVGDKAFRDELVGPVVLVRIAVDGPGVHEDDGALG